jgi:hypothetical protein
MFPPQSCSLHKIAAAACLGAAAVQAAVMPADPVVVDYKEHADLKDIVDFAQPAGPDVMDRALLTQRVLGAPQDPFAPRRGPLVSSPYRESVLGNTPALVPGPLARL